MKLKLKIAIVLVLATINVFGQGKPLINWPLNAVNTNTVLYNPKVDTIACYMQVAYRGDTVGIIRTAWQTGFRTYDYYSQWQTIYLDDNKKPITNLVFISIDKKNLIHKSN